MTTSNQMVSLPNRRMTITRLDGVDLPTRLSPGDFPPAGKVVEREPPTVLVRQGRNRKKGSLDRLGRFDGILLHVAQGRTAQGKDKKAWDELVQVLSLCRSSDVNAS